LENLLWDLWTLNKKDEFVLLKWFLCSWKCKEKIKNRIKNKRKSMNWWWCLQPLEWRRENWRIGELGVVLFCRGRPETGFEALGVVVFVVFCCGNARERIWRIGWCCVLLRKERKRQDLTHWVCVSVCRTNSEKGEKKTLFELCFLLLHSCVFLCVSLSLSLSILLDKTVLSCASKFLLVFLQNLSFRGIFVLLLLFPDEEVDGFAWANVFSLVFLLLL
jgi:hypothetical protein